MAYQGIPVTQIVAVTRNGVIGRAGTMPWNLPEDLKRFKALTLGKPNIMGRKTFDSIGRPLPGRTNIVITRQSDWSAEGTIRTDSLEAALSKAAECVPGAGFGREIMVIGGADIYAQAMPVTDRICLTRIEADIEGDTFYPDLHGADWEEVFCEPLAEDPAASHRARIHVFERITS